MEPSDRAEFERLLQDSVAYHGHCCAGQVIGVRMSMLGLRLIGIDDPRGSGGPSLYVVVEIDRCATDAIQSVTGCRLGKRSLGFKDFGKMAATFVNLKSSEAVRIVAREEARALANRLGPERADTRERQLQAYKMMSDEELFTVQTVRLLDPKGATLGRRSLRLRCDSCGEWVQDGRELRVDDAVFCRGCSDERYYRVVGRHH